MLKIVPAGAAMPSANSYLQKSIVSDQPDLAPVTDTNLVNPWGLATGPTTYFWVADNKTGVSTLYDGAGQIQSLVVTIPPAPGEEPPSAPTGVIFNNTPDFMVDGTPAHFIFAGEEGTISAWTSGPQAVLKASSTSETYYKGLALASSGGKNYLYAADFRNRKIDVFDGNFQPATLAGSFNDPDIPVDFAPFNIRNIGGQLFVTYAKQDDDKEDDVPGEGNGYISIFNSDGTMVKRFASQGALNSPWGLAMAPVSFGEFSGALLVGNFGDGFINAFDPLTGAFLGQLKNPNGILVWADGLWDLLLGNGSKGGDPDKLYFTAGISGEQHGLFGSVEFHPTFGITNVKREGNNLVISFRSAGGPFTLQKKEHLSDPEWTDVQSLTDTNATVKIEGAATFFRIARPAP